MTQKSTTEKSTPGVGNTKTTPAIKGRNFIMTINESVIPHTQDIIDYLENLKKFQYIIVCEHIGQDNKHYHLYVQFGDNKKLTFKKLYGAHVDKSFGSAQQNIAYVKAEDAKHKKLGVTSELIYENGEPKLNGGLRIKDIEEMTQEQIKELPAQLVNVAKKIKQDYEADIDIDDLNKTVKVIYISGPSGCGKTTKAKEIIRENADKYGRKINMIKYENGFYHGVGNAKIALYDDFRDSHMKPSEFINLVDYNKHYMNIKGGSKLNQYELIIITSVQRLNRLYPGLGSTEPKLQWLRRIEEIRMNGEDEDNENDIDIDNL